MKTNLFFLFVLLPCLAFAQRIASIEIASSLNFTDYTNKIANTEGRLNYDFGISMAFPMKNENREWLMGIELMAYGNKTVGKELKWGTQHDGNGGYDPTQNSGELPSTVSFKSNNYYLEIPFSMRQYLTNGKKLRLFVQASAGPSIYLTSHNIQTISYTDDSVQNSIYDNNSSFSRKLNMAGKLSFGIQYGITEKFQIQLMPRAQAQFFNTIQDSPSGANWYAFGLQAGLRYRLL